MLRANLILFVHTLMLTRITANQSTNYTVGEAEFNDFMKKIRRPEYQLERRRFQLNADQFVTLLKDFETNGVPKRDRQYRHLGHHRNIQVCNSQLISELADGLCKRRRVLDEETVSEICERKLKVTEIRRRLCLF